MKEIKLAKWRYYLTFFLLLTSVRLVVDCLYKLGMPFRDVLALILNNAVLPAAIVAVVLIIDLDRKKEIV